MIKIARTTNTSMGTARLVVLISMSKLLRRFSLYFTRSTNLTNMTNIMVKGPEFRMINSNEIQCYAMIKPLEIVWSRQAARTTYTVPILNPMPELLWLCNGKIIANRCAVNQLRNPQQPRCFSQHHVYPSKEKDVTKKFKFENLRMVYDIVKGNIRS